MDLQMGPEYGDLGNMEEDGNITDSHTRASRDSTAAMSAPSGNGTHLKVLNEGMPMDEGLKLCDLGRGILDSICLAAVDSVSANGYSRYAVNVHNLIKTAVLGHSPSLNREQLATLRLDPGSDASLMGLATLCRENDTLESGVQLAGVFSAMEFATHVQWYDYLCLPLYLLLLISQ